MKQRLPLSTDVPSEGIGRVRPSQARPRWPGVSIALVPVTTAVDVEPLARLFVEAFVANETRVSVLVVRRGGSGARRTTVSDHALRVAGAEEVVLLDADFASIERAIDDEYARAHDDACVLVGVDVPALVRPTCTIALAHGTETVPWSDAARAVRDRVDAVFSDARPRFVRGLVARCLSERGRAAST